MIYFIKKIFDYKKFCFSSKTVDILIHESGCVLEHEQASNFRELIMLGKWTEVNKEIMN